MAESQTTDEPVKAVPVTVEDVRRWLAAWSDGGDDAKSALVRGFLLAYAWAEDSDDAETAVVACIMAQDDWRYVDTLADRFAGAQAEPGPEAFAEGIGYALTALYECHAGPHLPTCPNTQ
jgi:hypothetical protein